MIAYNYKSELIFYGDEAGEGGNMRMDTYIRKILPYVYDRQKELAKKGQTMTFQEDNDGAHGNNSFENDARLNKDEHQLEFIPDWPAKSPDLSPIKNVWRLLKSRVKLHAAQTVEELKKKRLNTNRNALRCQR
jgi:hypothetical protein